MSDRYIDIREYDYPLPEERIALKPLEERDQSRLLHFDTQVEDRRFDELPELLSPGDHLIFNDSRVINARFYFAKPTGGVVEIFCLHPAGDLDPQVALSATGNVRWQCLVGGSKKWKQGSVSLDIPSLKINVQASRGERVHAGWMIDFSWDSKHSFSEILEAAGSLPLPPYIEREVDVSDHEDYQTVYADPQGSVAAPTAGLHFSEDIIDRLRSKGVSTNYLTLHVGAGTFRPVVDENAAQHDMHAETFVISIQELRRLALLTGRRIAVGTTVTRTLESLYWIGVKVNGGNHDYNLSQWEAYALDGNLSWKDSFESLINSLESAGESQLVGQTALMITPGYKFHIDGLMTNFHLPKSTLLLLVSAFIGEDWKHVYDHALDHGYRFLSYGDTSLLWPKKAASVKH